MAHRTVSIVSDFLAARDVQRAINEDAESVGFDPDSIFDVKLALEEALINAIKHGNKMDPAKKVMVEWDISAERIEIIIEDQGAGFNRSDVPDPTDVCNLEKLTGRGILLIESYMDEVEWTKGGRRIRMVRYRKEDNARRCRCS